jgi:hypothetical protein
MATVVEKEGVSWVIICHQPVEGCKHVLSSWLIVWFRAVVGENNHANGNSAGTFRRLSGEAAAHLEGS